MTTLLQRKKGQDLKRKPTHMSIEEFLVKAKNDPSCYAPAAERLLAAIGEPKLVDTSTDARLSRIHGNRVIKRYDIFKDFFGMEETINQIVSYLKHSAQGLEESKQVLYLLGPVGSAKSSLAEKLKALMTKAPIYRLAIKDEDGAFIPSPVNDSVFGLFGEDDYDALEEEYGIPRHIVGKHLISPWAAKRLAEFEGDYSQFYVEEIYPSILDQIGIAKTEPGDENNQDISTLVGKVDIRQLEYFSQTDADAYGYSSGALCKANQGLMEFVEMFKAPIKVLHPLLTATQEGNYNPTEGMSAIPFEGIILAHSNESEWTTFRNNKNNEAFLDRVYIVKVPYCLRYEEEEMIYQKLIKHSKLSGSSCAPHTLSLLAQWSVLTRLGEHPNNPDLVAKMRVYNGENLKDEEVRAASLQEYLDMATDREGMEGMSTRFAFKIASAVFNFDDDEIAANPVHLFKVLEDRIKREGLPQDITEKYVSFIHTHLIPKYFDVIGKEIQEAYLDSYTEYGQNIYDRYVNFADHWVQDNDYRDQDTGAIFDRSALNAELEKIEKPAGISNPKDFRNEIVNFNLRAKANNGGESPDWREMTKFKAVIEKKMFSSTEDLLPILSFGNANASEKDADSQQSFLKRMVKKGYTEKQVRLISQWYLNVRKSN